MSRSQAYWERRKARELYQELVKAEDAAEELRQAYIKASNEIEAEALHLVKRFQLRNQLTVKDAERLLDEVKDPEDIKALLRQLKKDPKNSAVVAELESQAYAVRIGQLVSLQAAIDAAALTLLGQAESQMAPVLADIGNAMYYREIFAMQQRAGAAFPFSPLDPKRISQILSRRWEGASFSERLWANREKLAKDVKEQLLIGALTGRSPAKMVKEIEQKFSSSYNATRRLVRTEANYLANQLQLESYKDVGVERYIYVAILDLRTSAICRDLDKKVFPLDKAKVGENYPPMHPWCRSTTIAWMPKELLQQLRQSARDPITGDTITVSGDMSYEDWYAERVAENPQALQKEKSIRAIAKDQKQFAEYKELLGQDVPQSVYGFQEIKYNSPERWAALKRQAKTFRAIARKPWSDTFKEKARGTYRAFRAKGYEFSDHALARYLDRSSSKRGVAFGEEDLLAVLARPANYRQPTDGRLVRFYDGLTVIQDTETQEVVSIINSRKTPRKDWIAL